MQDEPNEKLGVIDYDMVTLHLQNAQEAYPGKLQRVIYHYAETGQYFVFLTNNFKLTPILMPIVSRLGLN